MKPTKLLIIAMALAWVSSADAQTVDKKALTLEGAKKVIAAAVTEAKSKNAPGGASQWLTKAAISSPSSGSTTGSRTTWLGAATTARHFT